MSRGWGFVWEGLGEGSFIQASSIIKSSGSISVDILVMTRGGSGAETVWICGKAERGWLEDSASSFGGSGTSSWEVAVGFGLVEWSWPIFGYGGFENDQGRL